MSFEVFTAVLLIIQVFLDVMLCHLVSGSSWTAWHLKMKALHSFEMSRTIDSLTPSHPGRPDSSTITFVISVIFSSILMAIKLRPCWWADYMNGWERRAIDTKLWLGSHLEDQLLGMYAYSKSSGMSLYYYGLAFFNWWMFSVKTLMHNSILNFSFPFFMYHTL